jgi:predicted AAA+ superfamily ATPase
MTIGRFQNTRFQVIFLQIESLDFNLQTFEKQLLIIDEVQLKPDLFRTLQALIERRKREKEIWAIEIKRTTAPKNRAGLHRAVQDVKPTKKIGV